MKSTMRWGLGLVLLGLAVGVVLAQVDPARVAVQVTEARKQNRELARQYSWNVRTEVKVKGEVKSETVELVRYTLDGSLQRTPIGGEQAGKQTKKMKNWGEQLHQLLYRYSLPTAGSILDYLDAATFDPGDKPGTVRITGHNVVQPGDELVMWVEPGTRHPDKTQVRTTLDGDAVTVETEHARHEELNYVSRSVVTLPAKQVVMTVEHFNYARQ